MCSSIRNYSVHVPQYALLVWSLSPFLSCWFTLYILKTLLTPFKILFVLTLMFSLVKADIKYIGCYEDRPQRLLNGLGEGDLAYDYPKSYFTLPKMTPDVCGNVCASLHFKYSGVEQGNQCFCGNILPPRLLVGTQTACTTACSGDSKKKCGGVWSIQVYETSPPKNPGLCALCQWACISCYDGAIGTVGCFTLTGICAAVVAIVPPLEVGCGAMLAPCTALGTYSLFNCQLEKIAKCSCEDFSQYCGPQWLWVTYVQWIFGGYLTNFSGLP